MNTTNTKPSALAREIARQVFFNMNVWNIDDERTFIDDGEAIIMDALAPLIAERDRLREAVEFYAQGKKCIEPERGAVARAVLRNIDAEGGGE